MAGYGASARLDSDLARLGRPPRLEPVRSTRSVFLGSAAAGLPPIETDPAPFEEVRAVRAPTPAALLDRFGRLRALWVQTTFYLFSPDSWR